MTSPVAFDTIHDYLQAVWTATPLAFENDRFEPPKDPEAWVLIEISGNFFEQETIGAESRDANLWREGGQVYAHVMVPRGDGSRQARALAFELASLFRGLDIGTLTFLDASIGAGGAGDVDGSYFRMTATIDWQRDL